MKDEKILELIESQFIQLQEIKSYAKEQRQKRYTI